MNAPRPKSPVREHYLAQWAALKDALPGAGLPWLRRSREAAIDLFAETGFPTTRDEQWKYTSLAALEKRGFTPSAAAPASDSPALADRVAEMVLDPTDYRLVFVDGRFVPSLSQTGTLPDGVTLASFAGALSTHPQALEPFFQREELANGAAALNAAFAADGAFIGLAPGVVLDRPVHLLFVGATEGVMGACRNLVHAGAGSRATIVEHHVGLNGDAYFTATSTQILQEREASVEHIKLQQEGPKALHIAEVRARQGEGSRFVSHSIALGGLLGRTDVNVLQGAERCETVLNGLYVVEGRQHIDHHTRIDHAKPNGTSREMYRGILDGFGRAVFNGKVIVHQDAQHTDAQQSNDNLLLSRDAEVDTKPELEIYADDVKCAHGATIGQLDDTMLFYLRSRGMGEREARSLLIYAFADDVIRRIELTTLRRRLEALLIGRLPDSDHMKELV